MYFLIIVIITHAQIIISLLFNHGRYAFKRTRVLKDARLYVYVRTQRCDVGCCTTLQYTCVGTLHVCTQMRRNKNRSTCVW